MKNGKFVAQERSPALIDGVITDTVRFICLPSFRKIEKKTEIMEKKRNWISLHLSTRTASHDDHTVERLKKRKKYNSGMDRNVVVGGESAWVESESEARK